MKTLEGLKNGYQVDAKLITKITGGDLVTGLQNDEDLDDVT